MYVDLDYREFELGDGASIEIKPLDSKSYQTMLEFMTHSSITGDAEQGNMASATKHFTNPKFAKLIKQVLPSHCRNLFGITIKEDGNERSAVIDDLLEIGAFLTMRMNIMMKLFNISTLTLQEETEIKKDRPDS